ncbi:major tail protein [Arthrobacter phage Shambre1]|uniref:Major tail protein n=1 Tax=Arthrobacter phage Shambre1 TaxID=2927284 RepID=A0A977PT13_9CAUD|nr:major tail protein [Arthrobacter phage Shambre1]UXE04751.1 major tail protein [Arthrobacter phage Shambre1]
MAETKNLDDIRVYGDLDSEVWLAPKGTTLPTTWGDPAAPFTPLGWLSEEGVTLALSTDVAKFKGYQGGTTLRTKVTSAEKTITMQALQDNPDVSALYWGHGEPEIIGVAGAEGHHAKIAIPKSPGTVERTGVIKFVDDEVIKYLLCENLQVTEREDIPHQNSEMSAYGFTFEIVGDMWILTNAPAYLGV